MNTRQLAALTALASVLTGVSLGIYLDERSKPLIVLLFAWAAGLGGIGLFIFLLLPGKRRLPRKVSRLKFLISAMAVIGLIALIVVVTRSEPVTGFTASVDGSGPGQSLDDPICVFDRPATPVEGTPGADPAAMCVAEVQHGDRLTATCVVSGQLIRNGAQGEPGYFEDSRWVAVAVDEIRGYLSNTWFARDDLPPDLQTCDGQPGADISVNRQPPEDFPSPTRNGPEIRLANGNARKLDRELATTRAVCRDRSLRSRRNDARFCLLDFEANNPNEPELLADPCFLRDDESVACPRVEGDPILLRAITWLEFAPEAFPSNMATVAPGEAIGSSYPWRIDLDNGKSCLWQLFLFPGQAAREGAPQWACGPDISFVTTPLLLEDDFDIRRLAGIDAALVYRPLVGLDVAFDLRVEPGGDWTALYGTVDAPSYRRVRVSVAWY